MAYTGKINPDNERKYLNSIIESPQNPQQQHWAMQEIKKYPVLPQEGTSVNTETPIGGQPAGTERMEFAYSPETLEYLEKFKSGVDTPFSYDPTTDPLYGPMREQYTQAGKAAFENTIGRLSALTGGRPSTAAVGTAANAANQYDQQFAGTVLPSLTQQAFERHQSQRADEANLLGILMNKDTSEFDRQLAIEEFEWSRNENNPAVRSQILNNMITEFQVNHMEEEWGWKVREWESRKIELDLLDKYAPELAKLGYEKLKEEVTQAKIRTNQMLETEDENKPPSAGQLANYNERKRYLLNLGSVEDAMNYLENYSGALENGMGSELYRKLIDEFQSMADQEFAPPDESQSPLYKNATTAIADIMKEPGKKTIDKDSEKVTITPRKPLIDQALNYLKNLVENGVLTAAEADEIALINGISKQEMEAWLNPSTNAPQTVIE